MKRYLAIAGFFLLVGTLSIVAWYGEPLKVHPDELKPGTTVTVYATTDVTLLTSVPAVLIRFADL